MLSEILNTAQNIPYSSKPEKTPFERPFTSQPTEKSPKKLLIPNEADFVGKKCCLKS